MKKEPDFEVEVDRVEEGIAVLVLSDDDKVKFNLPVRYLPKGVRDGDHLRVSLKLDEKSREAQKERVSSLLKELTGGKGDKSDA